ncbi:MAG: PAS domain-containing protein, partial [Bacteroidetes bacterium]|nr:PAS domain-containing protein [Bacteroidota bacterium]
MLNKLLLQQVKDCLQNSNGLPANVRDLLEAISASAAQSDIEGERIQQSIHLKTSQRIAKIGSWEMDMPDPEDLTQNRHYWSAETYRIFGFPPGSTIDNESFYSRIPAEDQQHIKTVMENALATGSIYDVTHRL